jgi:Holliday junction resolvase RusA-like endonuclease
MPPSINSLYTRARNGMVVVTGEGRAFEVQVKNEVAKQIHNLGTFNDEDVYGIDIILYFESLVNKGWFEFYKRGPKKGQRKSNSKWKRVDVDNRIKFLQDCVAAAVGMRDDSQIFEGHQRKVEGETGAWVKIYKVSQRDFLGGENDR